MNRLGTALLLVNGLGFIGTGVYAFLFPVQLAELAQFSLRGNSGITEFWANYGGLYLFYGLFLCWSALTAARRRAGVLVLLFSSAGLAVGRALGMTLIGFSGWAQISFLTWELLSALLCLVYLGRRSR